MDRLIEKYLGEKIECPKEVKSVWDNGGKTMDRYVIFLQGSGWDRGDNLSLSSDPDGAQGLSQFDHSGKEGSHLGKKINWNRLPDNIQKHIIRKLKE